MLDRVHNKYAALSRIDAGPKVESELRQTRQTEATENVQEPLLERASDLDPYRPESYRPELLLPFPFAFLLVQLKPWPIVVVEHSFRRKVNKPSGCFVIQGNVRYSGLRWILHDGKL